MQDMSQAPTERCQPECDVKRQSTTPTLVDLLHNQAATLGEKAAFRFLPGAGRDELILTYRDLHCRAMAIAAELQTRTVPGDRVLLNLTGGGGRRRAEAGDVHRIEPDLVVDRGPDAPNAAGRLVEERR
mgnify:CR=1 FL=1